MKKKILGILVCMLLVITAFPAAESLNNSKINKIILNTQQSDIAGNWTERQKLLTSDGETGDYFGCAVSISGDTALIGAEFDKGDGGESGSAYVFTCTNNIWTQQQKLLSETEYWLGRSVSLDGDTALIGTASEVVYVFIRTDSNWVTQAKLIASDITIGDGFGISVSIDGDTALIGAWLDDDNGVDSGSAYVFARTGTTWTQRQKLTASDGTVGDYFGHCVSLDGDTALIGAANDDDNGLHSGSAYVFTRIGTTWTQQAKLLASDGAAWNQFSCDVSLDGNTALIGALFSEGTNGSAYVFTRTGNTWTQQDKLLALDGAPNDNLGASLSLDNNTVIACAPYDDNGRGSAYVFIRNGTTWTQQQKFFASDGTSSDFFGNSVSLDGNTVIIGAVQDYDTEPGSAYVFSSNRPPNPPTITGPAKGTAGVATEYNFTAIDPQGDEVSYFIDWGDDSNSGWLGSYTSGDQITESHTWSTKGTYSLQAKAKDIYGNESDWATLTVTMPCSYNEPMPQFLDWLFQRFPNAFPLLRQLLDY